MPFLVEDVLAAKFKGAIYFPLTSSTTGGKKVSKKEFIGTRKQVIEELGGIPRSFEEKGTLAELGVEGTEGHRSYKDVRDAFLRAVESDGPGVFDHPFFGPIPNMVCVSYSLNESLNSVGDAKISFSLQASNTDGLPVQEEGDLAGVLDQNISVQANVSQSIESEFGIDARNPNNFTDATDQQTSFTDRIEAASERVSATNEKRQAFQKKIQDYRANITERVAAPVELATEFTGLMTGMNDLYEQEITSTTLSIIGTVNSFTDAQRAFDDLFLFGLDDSPIQELTDSLIKRKRNRNTFNSAVRVASLGYLYENSVSRDDYKTADDIEERQAQLDAQFEEMAQSPDVSDELVQDLQELRGEAALFFDAVKLTRRQVTTSHVNRLSARLVAYQLYEDSELGKTLMELNGLPDPYELDGTVQVLTA